MQFKQCRIKLCPGMNRPENVFGHFRILYESMSGPHDTLVYLKDTIEQKKNDFVIHDT